MAYIESKFCALCAATRQFCNGQCSACADRLKREKLAVWNSRTVEEQLHELLARVEKLERGPQRYA